MARARNKRARDNGGTPRQGQQRRDTILPILKQTLRGQEAAMYAAIRDLFVECLGYAADRVVADIAGADGRPDVTVRAESGITATNGQPRLVDWIVVEAKPAPQAFMNPASRERIFDVKAKYVTPNTAWFVMVDPTTIVARPVDAPAAQAADIVVDLRDIEDISLVEVALQRLHANLAGVPAAIERFREGDPDLIGYQKLSRIGAGNHDQLSETRIKVARRRFSAALRNSAQELCDATEGALNALMPTIEDLRGQVKTFKQRYENAVVAAVPPVAHASATGREEQAEMQVAARALRLALQRSRSVARLAVDILPKFARENGEIAPGSYRRFAVESAHLLLARVLLLRFLEDNGFFGDRKYVCNGGVHAFQSLFAYFGFDYTKLLEQAYGEGAKVYAAAFDSSELDWVTSIENPEMSRAIERALFHLSQFDFRTIRGDVLNGIYEKFQDSSQRKLLGEYYTPPSIAAYMLRKSGFRRGVKLFDPACGSGTFLIAAYDIAISDYQARGVADYDLARDILESLAGNDLNGFSSVLTQIQLLWHLMPFRDEMLREGLPALRVTENVNSLRIRRVDDHPTPFEELDQPAHDIIAGNPPYVRAERSDGGLDRLSERHYRDSVGAINVAGLFVYRALEQWARSDASGGGRLSFVLPASVFDGQEYEKLRRTFLPGPANRWRLTGITDLEAIHQQVFPDAKVIPIILFAEARPASWEDMIEISSPTAAVVEPSLEGHPIFHLDRAPSSRVNLRDLLPAARGVRIQTRLTPGRARILRELENRRTVEDVAARFWVRKQGSRIAEWSATPPAVGAGANWAQREAIGGGMTFRGTQPGSLPAGRPGPRLWKGQHIVAGELVGSPLVNRLNLGTADDPGVLRYRDVLPPRGWVCAQIALTPCLAPFQSDTEAFDNTVTIFFPNQEAQAFPFDLMMASRVYTWIYGVGHRMGLLARSSGRSHIYPTNFRCLPVPDDLHQHGPVIESLRQGFRDACLAVNQSVEAMLAELRAVPTLPFREAARQAGSHIGWSDAFDAPDLSVSYTDITIRIDTDATRITFGDLLTFVDIDDPDLANRLLASLQVQEDLLKRRDILALDIPRDNEALLVWQEIIDRFAQGAALERFERELTVLDEAVARALGLSDAHLRFVRWDSQRDPILRELKPRLPGAEPRAQGLVLSLKSGARYRT